MNDLMSDGNGTKVYIDGACWNNGRPNAAAGYGIFFNFNHAWNRSKPVKGRATNNVAEIQAATHAINIASKMGLDELYIHTDSKFLIDAHYKWIKKWKQNNWTTCTGRQVKNHQDFKYLDRAICRNEHMRIEFEHVRGHSGDPFNEEADRLAKEGARKYQN